MGKDDAGDITLACPNVSLGRLYPEEVSAQVLAQLLRDATAHLGAPVRKAVISVPAYFDDKQREATIEAGGQIGHHLDHVVAVRCSRQVWHTVSVSLQVIAHTVQV